MSKKPKVEVVVYQDERDWYVCLDIEGWDWMTAPKIGKPGYMYDTKDEARVDADKLAKALGCEVRVEQE